MSGVLSEGVAPTLGLFGYIAMRALFGRWALSAELIYLHLTGLLHYAHSHFNGCGTCLSR